MPNFPGLSFVSSSSGVTPVIPEVGDFIFSVNTENTGTGGSNTSSFGLPLVDGGTYDFIFYPEPSDSSIAFHITSWDDSAKTYDYDEPRTNQQIIIRGICDGFSFGRLFNVPDGDRLKMLDVTQVGNLKLGNIIDSHFSGCYNMVWSATDPFDFSDQTTLEYSWWNCDVLTEVPSLSSTDCSNLLTVEGCFRSSGITSQIVMNTTSCTNFTRMLSETNYNHDVVGFISTDSAITMEGMFAESAIGQSSFSFTMAGFIPASAQNLNLLFENCLGYRGNGFSSNTFTSLTSAFGMCGLGSIFDTNNYTDTLVSFFSTAFNSNVQLGMGNSTYFSGVQSLRDQLTVIRGWTITDGGPV